MSKLAVGFCYFIGHSLGGTTAISKGPTAVAVGAAGYLEPWFLLKILFLAAILSDVRLKISIVTSCFFVQQTIRFPKDTGLESCGEGEVLLAHSL